MEIISQACLDNATSSNSNSFSSENEVSNHHHKKGKRKVRKRVLCALVLMIFIFEVFYLFLSKLTYNEIEELIRFMTSSNVSLPCSK